MPVVIGGTTYYAFESFPVEANGSDNRVLNTPIVVRNLSASVLTPLDPVTQDPITDFRSSAVNGLSPSCLLPALVVTYDAGAGAIVVKSSDVADLAQDATDAVTAAQAAQAAAEAALAAVQSGGSDGTDQVARDAAAAAQSTANSKQAAIPTVTTTAAADALPTGTIYIYAP